MQKKSKEIKLGSEKITQRNKFIHVLKLSVSIVSLGLISLYLVLQSIYGKGNFTVSLDQDLTKNGGIVLYENKNEKDYRQTLYAESLEAMTNISVNWLPQDIGTQSEGGPHNGDNYIAYTFYLENQGKEEINYWYSISIDDVIKGVDDAIRIMVFQNGQKTIYAKATSSGDAEPGTEKFYSNEYVLMKNKTNFKKGEIDKYTIVVWIEGDDPQCVDALIGGKMNMTMKFQSEIIEKTK